MKKQSNLSRLMDYAGGHRLLTYLSWILSAVSALLALVPFWYIWRIIHDILEVAPDYSKAGHVTSYGWSAVLFAVLSVVIYIAALMCSHLSAFRVAANIRKAPAEPYCGPAPWHNGKVRERKFKADRKYIQRCHGNLSGPQAAG